MQTIRQDFNLTVAYPIHEWRRDAGSLLFFDIETTGFSASYHQVYLIGCVFYQNQSWHMVQWFDDTGSSEAELLSSFFRFARNFSVLVHFNGDRFDIPFLLKRCQTYSLRYSVEQLHSFDIYRKIKPFQTILEMEQLKLKSIERFLSLRREDQYHGGQLIELYFHYIHNRHADLYHLLLLHNADDLKGMLAILPILHYTDFFEQQFTFTNCSFSSVTDIFGTRQPQLVLELSHNCPIPVSWEKVRTPFACYADRSTLTITIDLTEAELKLFYSNYRDYYYLPYEDSAIHKSVGEYVDKTARKKATPQTCYTKKEGVFLPLPPADWKPVFQHHYKDSLGYVLFEEILFQNNPAVNRYIQNIFSYINKKQK